MLVHVFLLFLFLNAGLSAENGVVTEANAIDQSQPAVVMIQPHNPAVAVFDFNDEMNFKAFIIDLIKAAKNPTIKGILFIIDNCGGRSVTFGCLHDMIVAIKKDKPVVGFVCGIAYSGGYHTASAMTYLIAGNFSDIGSIGVTRTIKHYRNKKIKDGNVDADLQTEFFSAGRYKATGNYYAADLSQEERNYIQNEVEKCYESFKASVAQNRNLDLSLAEQWAEGKLFSGPEALQLGLIDEIGTLLDAERKLIELIQLKNPELRLSDSIDTVFMGDFKKT
jgi:protease-4